MSDLVLCVPVPGYFFGAQTPIHKHYEAALCTSVMCTHHRFHLGPQIQCPGTQHGA